MKDFSLGGIVAMDQNMGIGIDNRLPWHNPSDVKHFWDTIGYETVIVGRRTWDSAKKFFKRHRGEDSTNYIVITSRDDYEFRNESFEQGFHIAHNAEEALKIAKKLGNAAWVCGGLSIYKMFKDDIDLFFITNIAWAYQCDTYLPDNIFADLRKWDFKYLPHVEGYPDCSVSMHYRLVKSGDNGVKEHMERLNVANFFGEDDWR